MIESPDIGGSNLLSELEVQELEDAYNPVNPILFDMRSALVAESAEELEPHLIGLKNAKPRRLLEDAYPGRFDTFMGDPNKKRIIEYYNRLIEELNQRLAELHSRIHSDDSGETVDTTPQARQDFLPALMRMSETCEKIRKLHRSFQGMKIRR